MSTRTESIETATMRFHNREEVDDLLRYAGADCFECGKSGFVSRESSIIASENDLLPLCKQCGCDHDAVWDPDTIEVLSTYEGGMEIEAECECGTTLYAEICPRDLGEI